jgi:hypothetical protein
MWIAIGILVVVLVVLAVAVSTRPDTFRVGDHCRPATPVYKGRFHSGSVVAVGEAILTDRIPSAAPVDHGHLHRSEAAGEGSIRPG